MTSAAPPVAPVLRNSRRFTLKPGDMTTSLSAGLSGGFLGGSGHSRSTMNGFSDALVCATAADVAAHGFVNVGVGGGGLFGEHRRGGHDLPGLAGGAMGHVLFKPSRLHGEGGRR